jgi:hypothetical protein
MSLLQEIIDWAAGLPAWQSDALRRLFSQGTLSSKDEAEILAMALKGPPNFPRTKFGGPRGL